MLAIPAKEIITKSNWFSNWSFFSECQRASSTTKVACRSHLILAQSRSHLTLLGDDFGLQDRAAHLEITVMFMPSNFVLRLCKLQALSPYQWGSASKLRWCTSMFYWASIYASIILVLIRQHEQELTWSLSLHYTYKNVPTWSWSSLDLPKRAVHRNDSNNLSMRSSTLNLFLADHVFQELLALAPKHSLALEFWRCLELWDQLWWNLPLQQEARQHQKQQHTEATRIQTLQFVLY